MKLSQSDREKYRAMSRGTSYPLLLEGTPLFNFVAGVDADTRQFRTTKDRGHINGVTFMPEVDTAISVPDPDLDSVILSANLGGQEFITNQPASLYQYSNIQSLSRRKIPVGVEGGKSQTLNLTVTNNAASAKDIQALFFRQNPYWKLSKFKSLAYGLKSQSFQLNMAAADPTLDIELPAGSGDMIGFSFTTSSGAPLDSLLGTFFNLRINSVEVVTDASVLAIHTGGKFPEFFFPLWIDAASTAQLRLPTVAGGITGLLSVTFYFDN